MDTDLFNDDFSETRSALSELSTSNSEFVELNMEAFDRYAIELGPYARSS